VLKRNIENLELKRGGVMDKRQVKGKLDRAVKRTKHQVEEWTDDTRAQVEDVADQVKDKAEHAWDKMKHAARDVKQKATS
jgi:uncharacterized protein YjbJ (UPF0337 family)